MEKSILMKTWEAQAVLDNKKTQKRIAIKPQPKENHMCQLGFVTDSTDKTRIGKFAWGTNEYGGVISLAKPPYQIGDILWAKETWGWNSNYFDESKGKYEYKADYKIEDLEIVKVLIGGKWRTSIHMPKEAARIWLKVVDVRVERLQDITPEQLVKEGLGNIGHGIGEPWYKAAYEELKNKLGCNDDDWLWVITFERTEKK